MHTMMNHSLQKQQSFLRSRLKWQFESSDSSRLFSQDGLSPQQRFPMGDFLNIGRALGVRAFTVKAARKEASAEERAGRLFSQRLDESIRPGRHVWHRTVSSTTYTTPQAFWHYQFAGLQILFHSVKLLDTVFPRVSYRTYYKAFMICNSSWLSSRQETESTTGTWKDIFERAWWGIYV